jgi:hypothetical protein
MNCTLGTCSSFAIARNLCEAHFRQQYIAPYDKQIANTESLLSSLRANRAELSRELNIGIRGNRTSLEEIDRKNQMAGRHAREAFTIKDKELFERQMHVQHGDIEALKYVYCERCHKPYKNQLELVAHKQDDECIITLGKHDEVPKRSKADIIAAGKAKKSVIPNGRVAKPKVQVDDSIEDYL